jgi:hypothetical protein
VKRFFRVLLDAATGLLLLLRAGALVLWARSYYERDEIMCSGRIQARH